MTIDLTAQYDWALFGENYAYASAYSLMVASTWSDTITPRPYSLMGSGTFKYTTWNLSRGFHLYAIVRSALSAHLLAALPSAHLTRGRGPFITAANYVCTAQANRYFVEPYRGSPLGSIFALCGYNSTVFPGVNPTMQIRVNLFTSENDTLPDHWAMTRPGYAGTSGSTDTLTINTERWVYVSGGNMPLKKYLYVIHSVLNYEDVPNPNPDDGIYPTETNYGYGLNNTIRMTI